MEERSHQQGAAPADASPGTDEPAGTTPSRRKRWPLFLGLGCLGVVGITCAVGAFFAAQTMGSGREEGREVLVGFLETLGAGGVSRAYEAYTTESFRRSTSQEELRRLAETGRFAELERLEIQGWHVSHSIGKPSSVDLTGVLHLEGGDVIHIRATLHEAEDVSWRVHGFHLSIPMEP